MATASPTPFPMSYGGNGRISRQSSMRHLARGQPTRPAPRRASPLSVLGHSHGFSADAPMMQRIDIGDSSDDEIPQPMKLSALTKALLEAEPSSPAKDDLARGETPSRAPNLRISRKSPPGSSTLRRTVSVSASYVHRDKEFSRNAHEHETPAPAQRAASGPAQAGGIPSGSIRVKRVPVGTGTFLRGAPVRKSKRTPQGEDEENQPPPMMLRPEALKAQVQDHRPVAVPDDEKPMPLAPMSVNVPHRPAPPPPPPKMTVLETATASGGASVTKSKRKRVNVTVNDKHFTLMGKIGKGGSSEVYRVMAENYKVFALKKVKLENIDESAVRGYKGEIELLKKLEKVERVVRLLDWEVDEERQSLSVLMEIGEFDLNRVLGTRLQAENAKLDLSFTRFYWKEMLECVAAVHAYDIVHSDLKPANFLLVSGRLKLIDFGIANAIDIDNTVNVHRESHVGTPNYMSPESIQDTNAHVPGSHSNPLGGASREKMMKLGKPSDVWSLGCILYQMVYGRPPFAHIVNQIHRIMAITNPSVAIEYAPCGVGGVTVPPALRATLKKCLDRDSSRRPTVEQLLDVRDAWLHPDAGPDLKISQEVLGQVIQRVAERFRDPRKPPPTDEEIKQYPASFYEKIRELLEST